MSRTRRTTLISSIFAGIVVLSLAILAVTSVTVEGVCESCHQVRAIAPGQGDGAHAEVACIRCHADGGVADRAELAAAVPLMLIGSAPQGVAQVSRLACLRCHAEVDEQVTNAGGLRIDHRACIPQGASCATCHDDTVHGQQGSGKLTWERSMGMEECVSCHDDERGSQECDTCHDGKMQRDRLTSGVWRLTHSADWEKKHGLGGTRMCTACHQRSDCSKCHEIELPHKPEFSRSHGDDYQRHPNSCGKCHEKSLCDSCHGIVMPHAPTFIGKHPEIVEQEGQKVCATCHLKKDCVTCHNRHVHPGWANRAGRETTGGAR